MVANWQQWLTVSHIREASRCLGPLCVKHQLQSDIND